MGIAVKKITTMLQKYVLPESTWMRLPFSEQTAKAELSRANIPARICIGNKINIIKDFFLSLYSHSIVPGGFEVKS